MVRMSKDKKKIEKPKPYTFYGKAGATFSDKDVQNKFGKSSVSSGALGEKILFNRLRGDIRRKTGGWLPEDIPLFCSLKVPGKASDIDFAFVVGNKIILIDAKMYGQSGGWYWSKGNDDYLHHNLGYYETSRGKKVKLSASMRMAQDTLSRSATVKKYGIEVYAITILVRNEKVKGSKNPNTWFLKYPGGIQAYNEFWGQFFIKRICRRAKRTQATQAAEAYLKRLVQ